MTFFSCFFVPYILIVSSDSSKSLLHRIQDVGSYFFLLIKCYTENDRKLEILPSSLFSLFTRNCGFLNKKSNWDRYLNSSLKWGLVFSWHKQTYFFIFFLHLIIKIFSLFSQTSKTYSIERLSSIIMYIQILTLVEAIVLLKNKMKIYII